MAVSDVGTFVESTRGKFLVSLNGFLYRKNQTSRTAQGCSKSYWICTIDHQRGCRAKIHVLEDTDPPIVVAKFEEHNHPPDFNQAGMRKVMNKMKKIVLQTNRDVDEIYESVLAEEDPPPEIIAALGDRKMVTRHLKKTRRRKSELPIGGDQGRNVLFVKTVEKHRPIYEHEAQKFMTRSELNHIWGSIAEELGESATDCKEKWRSIKAQYGRYIKQTNPTEEPWHYLLEHLQFFAPYANAKPTHALPSLAIGTIFNLPSEIPNEAFQTSNISSPVVGPSPSRNSDDMGLAPHDDTICRLNASGLTSDSPVKAENLISASSSAAQLMLHSGSTSGETNCHHVTDYLRAMRKRKREEEEEDADVGFLKSLMPDFRRMTEEQKHEFKLDVLGSIHRILYSKRHEGH